MVHLEAVFKEKALRTDKEDIFLIYQFEDFTPSKTNTLPAK